MRFRPRHLALILIALAGAAGCESITGPSASERDQAIGYLVVSASPDDLPAYRLHVVGLETRTIVHQSAPLLSGAAAVTLTPNGARAYLVGGDIGRKTSEMLAWDTQTGDVVWREVLATLEDSLRFRTDRFDGVRIKPSDHFDVSPDGRRIFIGHAERDSVRGVYGVAVLDSDTRDLVGFVAGAPNSNTNFDILPASDLYPDGLLVLSAVYPADPADPGGSTLLLADAGSLDVIDTVEVGSLPGGTTDKIVNVVAAPDGGSVYVRSGSGWLLRYDVAAGAITGRAFSSAPICERCVSVSPSGDRVFVAYTSTHIGPSAGLISVYDAGLEPIETIDLSAVQIEQTRGSATNPPALQSLAVAPDGTLVVSSGAASFQLWGSQAGRVLFVDPATHEVEHMIRLNHGIAAWEVLIP